MEWAGDGSLVSLIPPEDALVARNTLTFSYCVFL
jgi:hypothetical protein